MCSSLAIPVKVNVVGAAGINGIADDVFTSVRMNLLLLDVPIEDSVEGTSVLSVVVVIRSSMDV